MKLSAVILAGGESRRMGRDKAWLEVAKQPLIARAKTILGELGVQELFISGRPNQDYSQLRCPVLLDRQPGLGPLGGIECALKAATSPLLLVLAVDLPHMTTSFLSKLAVQCTDSTGVLPVRAGQLEPLAAIYPKRCHSIALELLEQSRPAACAFAEACLGQRAVRAYTVPPAEAGYFANWNHPADISSDNALTGAGVISGASDLGAF